MKKGSRENWKKVWGMIKEMRSSGTAPVDTMGASKLAETPKSESKKDKSLYNYQTLIGLMLSPQTKDMQTAKAMDILRDYGLTPINIIKTEQDKLDTLIKNVGFHKQKAKSILKATKIIIEKYDGDIPNELEGLLELPGVGPKIGLLCMQICFGVNIGIAVDTHVHRISNRLGWAKSKNPEGTRKQLEEWLPKEQWGEINFLLVGFGQEYCKAIKPNCIDCLARELCPFGRKAMGKKPPRETIYNK